MRLDEDLLICDFAETYKIYDIRALKPFTAGSLAYGLRPDSRIKLKNSGMEMPSLYLLATRMVDELTLARWPYTEAAKNGEKPQLLMDLLFNGGSNQKEREQAGYDTPEEFMRSYYGTEYE
jgi:hypothetical protein